MSKNILEEDRNKEHSVDTETEIDALPACNCELMMDEHIIPTTNYSTSDFFKALYLESDVLVQVKKKIPGHPWDKCPREQMKISQILPTHKNDEYYIPNLGGILDGSITECWCVYIDIDNGKLPNKFSLPPSAIISREDGMGHHVYWFLTLPTKDMELWKKTIQQLIEYYDSDKNVKNLARWMRIPDTTRVDPKDKCDLPPLKYNIIILNKNIRYSLTEILDAHNIDIDIVTSQNNEDKYNLKNTNNIEEGRRNSVLASIAGYYHSKKISNDALLHLIKYENEKRCNPPLDGKEVEKIVKSISKYPTNENQFIKSRRHANEETDRIIPKWIKDDMGGVFTEEQLRILQDAPPPTIGGKCYFLNLDWPEAGYAIIGARTGRGKSTSLANVGRELLEQGKNIIYVSLEEPFRLAFSRLAMSFGYARAYENDIHDFPDNSWLGRYNALRSHDEWVRLGSDIVVRYIIDKKLRIVDSTLTDSPREAKNFATAIKQNAGRHIILLDYFQILNIGEKRNYEIWGKIAGDLIEACGDKNLIIAAAQFNRTGTERVDGSSNYDPIAEQLRESASLEQLASFIIGAGWTASGIGTITHNWKLLKDRYGQIGADKYLKNNTPSEYRDRQFLAPNNNNWSTDPDPIENPLKDLKPKNAQMRQQDKKLWQDKI